MSRQKTAEELMPAKRIKAFVFTLNNYSEADEATIAGYAGDWLKYVCYGREVGDSGTKHLQGYGQLPKQMAFKKLITKFNTDLTQASHIEPRMGTVKQAIDYCKKEGDFHEFGEAPAQGKRTDLEHAAEMIRSGARMIEVADEHPGTFIRYSRGLEKYKQLHDKEKAGEWRDVTVTLLTGPTGCGKTRKAMEGGGYKIQGSQLKWWDGYEGEDTIIIDEYSNDVKVTELLGLLDGYKLRLPVKGGFTYANWTKVFITTNLFELHEQANEEHRKALERRISETISYWEYSGISAMAATKTSSAD